MGAHKAGSIISGATSESDALRKLKSNKDSFQRPLVCSVGTLDILNMPDG
jgi:hypothetical protein